MNIVVTLADDRSITESLRATLPKSDLLLFENTMQDAQRRLLTTRADVVLLDDTAPFGLDALKQLKETAPSTPVIVLASSGRAETFATFSRAGAFACVSKPFDCDELVGVIEDCIGGRQLDEANPPATPTAHIGHESIGQHQMALRWMGRATLHFDDTPKLVDSLADALTDIFDPARCCILLQGREGVRIAASNGMAKGISEALLLTFNQGLMRRLLQHTGLVRIEDDGLAPDAQKEMQALGGRLAMPLLTHGNVCGALILGEKSTGSAYEPVEIDLLTAMARCTSSCLEHAQRFRDSARQQNRLDAVLANISAGVVTVANDKTITMMNESAERILQLSAGDVLGRSVQKLGSAFADIVLRTMEEGEPRLRQQITDFAIGQALGLSVTPLGPEGVVVIFTSLPGELAQEGIAYSPIWKFLSTRLAQEIKNPMVAINTFAQLLPKRHESEEFRHEFAEVVQNEVGRINSVVEALYDFAGHPRPSMKRKDLSDNVRDILQRFDERLAEHSIEVETHFDAHQTPVQIDTTQFARAVENVIQNCIEAMPEGGTLKVITRRENGTCELIIADTGRGISEQDAPLVFTPFFSTKEKGMGLGLTMANRIVQEHEGNLALGTDTSGGVSFVFNLPTATAAEDTDEATQDQPQGADDE